MTLLPPTAMTELQQLETMLNRAGVVFRRQPYRNSASRSSPNEVYIYTDDNIERQGVDCGYPGFETIFSFDESGALIQVGSWE